MGHVSFCSMLLRLIYLGNLCTSKRNTDARIEINASAEVGLEANIEKTNDTLVHTNITAK